MRARSFNQKNKKRVQRPAHLPQSALRPLYHAVALMVAAGMSAHAHAAGIVNLGQVGARIAATGVGGAGGGAGMPNLGVSPQQALQASQPSIQNLGRAAQSIAAQIAAQQAAAAAAVAAANVPNGLATGGLQVAPGATNNSMLWQNANLPTQTVDANGHVDVGVKQNGQTAILTWQTMNVGRQTTLNFDQSGGTQSNGANNWVVLNRINDPSGAPSQILGNMNAQGSVYVINRNGILFGAGSQVNVHSLVASSLDFLNMNDALKQSATDVQNSNNQFTAQLGGLVGTQTSDPTEVLGLGNAVTTTSANAYQPPGDITIAPGASIKTNANGTVSDGGFVLIAAPNVTNAGSITTTNGQTILAAGVGVSVLPPAANSQLLRPQLSGQILFNGTDVTPAGTVTNTGIIQADKGNITLLGSNVRQNGVVGVTTGVSYPGSINISTVDEARALSPNGTRYLDASGTGIGPDSVTTPANRRAGLLSFGPDSVTTILPSDDGETATSSPTTSFTPGSITLTGRSIWMQPGSLIEAPGSTVSMAALVQSGISTTAPGDTVAPGRIYLDTGSTIDVSGLPNVEEAMASTLVTIPRIGQNELADSPLLRNSFLFGLKNVVVDSTLSGTGADGLQWVGSPILNLAGYVSLIPRSVDQLLVNGGTITLAGGEVMTANGSSLNLNGGYVHYLGGDAATTRLVDSNGLIVPIGKASPFDNYVGVAGQFSQSHGRWKVVETWYNPLLTGGAYQADYIVGGNAGTLNVFAEQALVLDGNISAQSLAGTKQVQGNAQPSGGSFTLGQNPLLADPAAVSLTGTPANVILQNTAPQLSDLAPGFGAGTLLDTTALNALGSSNPDNVLAWQTVPVDTLNAAGMSNVSVTVDKASGGSIVVAAGTSLHVQPGGSIKLTGTSRAPITVLGDLIAPSGNITLALAGKFSGTTPADITVGPDAVISTAGQWVNNDVQATGGTTTPGDSEYINGGSITLSVDAASATLPDKSVIDTTGSIVLQQGSVLDVSSGGMMQANGQLLMSNGIAQGKGGSITLSTYANGYGSDTTPPLPTTEPTAGQIVLDGTLKSLGFSGGGMLSLHGLGFEIGGDPALAPSWATVLPADFFASQGFGQYVLSAAYDAGIAAGTTVRVTQQNLLPDAVALQSAVSGSDIMSGGLTSIGALDPYHRQATNLTMTGGGYLGQWQGTVIGTATHVGVYPDVTGGVTVGEGASIVADAGASIGLGSPTQVTVLGSIVAPGGSITLSADTNQAYGFMLPGQPVFASGNGYTTRSQSVWVGPNAVLDVSGVALTNPLAAPVHLGQTIGVPQTGKILAGGKVVLSDDEGSVIVQAGARIDVSGTSANFDQVQSNGTYVSQPVWSDAGSITLGAANGLYFNGTLDAHGGAALAQGGTLTLLPEHVPITTTQPDGTTATSPGASALIIQQSGDILPIASAPGADLGTSNGAIRFSADRLDGSGISTLVLSGPPPGNQQPLPVAFAGDVNLSLGNAVIVNASQIVALAAGATSLPSSLSGISNIGTPTVRIDAPYVAFVGPSTVAVPTPVPMAAGGTLQVDASFVDLENQLQLGNFGNATFASTGDIRLSSTNTGGTSALLPGTLFTSGNVTFKAADVYPASGSTFVIAAVAPVDPSTGKAASTTVTFQSNGTSDVPLSAGGSLLVDATNIVQDGTVRAPSGSLIFGVSNAVDPATQKQFGGLPLVATQSVSLAPGSITSVSNGNTVIPYGVTVDGTEWQYNATNASQPADVTAPPAKLVSVNGSQVSLSPGATIDLSGGGDLQASEWIAGTGGSRNLLQQYNVSFATSSSGTAVPVNPGAANVYAVVPGYHAPVAAYDPVIAQVTQPTSTGGTQTVSMGVGQAGVGGMAGQAVYLQGVPGLPAGVYTLLPAQYATLPGAFRVVAQPNASTPAANAAGVLPDGTAVVAGYTVNALSGSRSSTPTLFTVQSGPVWQQYSQYTETSANTFFPALASKAGNATPRLPIDGGQLVLAATQGLTLGATLNSAPATGGAPANVDIASQDIQIVGNGEAALSGYLQIDAGQLDALGAGSLLIGGTRTQTTSGITINALANSVVVSNDASSPLSGPEILLVTKTDPTGTDPNASRGLDIAAGSVINATGSYPAAADQSITIGQNANTTTGAAAISGDGALLRVSQGAQVLVTRNDVTGTVPGLLTVGAGATLSGGQSLTLDSSGDLRVDPTVALSGKAIAADGSAITFTDRTDPGAANLPGFVIGPNTLAQLSNTTQLTLRSRSAMTFTGNESITFGPNVDLSAPTFASDGGSVVLNGQQIAFTNELGTTVPASTGGTGTLTVNAKEIDFGTGSKGVSGIGAVTMNASSGIVGQGSGSFDFGAAPVTFAAPIYLADTGSKEAVTTTGVLNLNAAGGTATTLKPLGGQLSFTGGTLNDNGATIAAPAGNVNLEATTGDLNVGAGSLVSSAGVALQFFDVTAYAPAGAIKLTADAGSINVQPGATLDFSGAAGGGAAGSVTLSAPSQTVQLGGTLKGAAAAGYLGGSFSLETGGAVDLDGLAKTLAASGVNDGISVWTKAGNLTLSAGNTLTAHLVQLTADGGSGGPTTASGNVQVLGTINAAGNAGGEIDLYGRSGVDVEGSLIATGSNPNQRGGTVNLGTTGTPDTVGGVVQLNPTYGYEDVSAANSGTITLGNRAKIDVSGGTAGGLSGGTVNFRAPLLSNGDVNVTLTPGTSTDAPGVQIVGSRATTLEAYAVWSTTDPGSGPKHFDSIVDPAGWYDSNGNLLAGTFTDQSGKTIAYTPGSMNAVDLANALQNDYFTPTTPNADHQTFYGYQSGTTNTPGTLMGFVENPGFTFENRFAGVANFHAMPGIELDNPSPAINNGDISIKTNWNLGAGSSPTNLAFRYEGQGPDITFRAEHDVQVDASLTDGFFQIANPTQPGVQTTTVTVTITPPSASSYHDAYFTLAYNPYYKYGPAYGPKYNSKYSLSAIWGAVLAKPAPASTFASNADAAEVAQYYGMYLDYLNDVIGPTNANGNTAHNRAIGLLMAQFRDESTAKPSTPVVAGQPVFGGQAPTAADVAADPDAWLKYEAVYTAYATAMNTWLDLPAAGGGQNSSHPYNLVPFVAPPAVLTTLVQPSTTTTTVTTGTPAPVDNTPSPVATSTNPLPLLTASLNGGASTSFRLVGGADLGSADPLALQPATSTGSVTIDGHFAYVTSTGGHFVDNAANTLTILAPTLIRTGTGSIDIAAANDITLLDTSAPGAIYTAGAPAAGTTQQGSTLIAAGQASAAAQNFLITPAVNPDSAGDISIHAQNDITGIENVVDTTGAVTGTRGASISQFWWPWMELGNVVDGTGTITQTSINFGAFDQGVMSVGGNVSVSAGGNITDLAVSLPTTYTGNVAGSTSQPRVVGGGNLDVQAGGDILSGDYFVANGTGTITAGGRIGSDGQAYAVNQAGRVGSIGTVSTLLATQNGQIDVSARSGADIGGILNPSYIEGVDFAVYKQHADSQGYSASSAVSIASTTGNVTYGAVGVGESASSSGGLMPFLIGSSSSTALAATEILPANLSLTAFTGGIAIEAPGQMYPSADGELSMLAAQSVVFSMNPAWTGALSLFGMIDSDPSTMPSPTNTVASSIATLNGYLNRLPSGGLQHQVAALHGGDTQPVRIYSLDGSIVNGAPDANGVYQNLMTLDVDKVAQLYAGKDIVNLAFNGQNLSADDVTRIVAGGNILDVPVTSLPTLSNVSAVTPAFVLGGPGTFDIEAGSNIGPFISQLQAPNRTTGINAVGNANNPFLPHESANVQVLFGVAPGIDNANFIATYIDPSQSVKGVPSTTPALIAFMEQYDAGKGVDTGLQADRTNAQNAVGTLTAAEAWKEFQALPAYVQQIFAQQVLFSVLTAVGTDYNNANSPFFQQYARGYSAIATMFPASLGYTANDTAGGSNGSNKPVSTGNLDIRSSTIQTQQGGSISILGPGGEALVGSSAAPPNVGNASKIGILTLEKGDINIFTDQSVLLAQSRIFTEQGGSMTIWSSNGDVNAGKGSKSIADVPPPEYLCDRDHYCTVDARGEVTGAGIATLQTIPGAAAGDVNLIAPRGTVDAGDAGIRASGTVNVAALHVANADNVTAAKSTGLQTAPTVDPGALAAASSAGSAVNQIAQDIARNAASGGPRRRWIITVEVEGFGDNGDDNSCTGDSRKCKQP
ncbi:filamentous haemagglutinin family protein [Paraburkholderia flava]|uniref:filamentous haemagglutinin family protein n=1 Tax=Paraburkholderia flava TaxID=2547393 RepID=UPI001F113FDD|nr:filamentous haemagglutinin family protein [Paraburkholderia flava]